MAGRRAARQGGGLSDRGGRQTGQHGLKAQARPMPPSRPVVLEVARAMAANPPRKHHYAPIFYLKRGTGPDGKLEQFSRPNASVVKVRRVYPAATGYSEDLYAMPGLPDHLVQHVEQKFMQEVDQGAAEALDLLEQSVVTNWTTDLRSAWTRFIQSLQLRTPADIAGIKRRTEWEWNKTIPPLQAKYDAIRGPSDPEKLEEYLGKGDPLIVERIGMWMATRLIDMPSSASTSTTWPGVYWRCRFRACVSSLLIALSKGFGAWQTRLPSSRSQSGQRGFSSPPTALPPLRYFGKHGRPISLETKISSP